MIWRRVEKELGSKPNKGDKYSDWKEFLAEEGFFQCVYCAINENNFGGMRNFHVEHYRPKSIERFKKLENDLTNLFYACSICNCFKGSHWEEEPDEDFNNFAFPDPSKVDYSTLFEIDFEKGIISPKTNTSTFLIHRLFLNRPQLILERQNFNLSRELGSILKETEKKENRLFELASEGDKQALELIRKSKQIIQNILQLLNVESSIRPYSESDIKRKP